MKLTIRNLDFKYNHREVLKNIDFTEENGNLICVLGRNGVGKSTLFKCILGLLSNYNGYIEVNGKDIKKMSEKEIASNISYIPQSHDSLFKFSVIDMVLMGTTSSLRGFSCPSIKHKKIAMEALKTLNIEHLANRTYSHLSGGEQQLVLISRAIAQQGKILIMDEPCSNLDYGNQIQVMKKVRELASKGYLIVQSTHNPDHAFLFADKVLVILDGSVRDYGNPREILTEELLEEVYGIPIELLSIKQSEYKICIPKEEGENYVGVI